LQPEKVIHSLTRQFEDTLTGMYVQFLTVCLTQRYMCVCVSLYILFLIVRL
jgi:hypothetical protein